MSAASSISARERFLRACRCQPVDRPPVWVMRQAGRYLPEYRALKEKHSFVEMVRTPELACEVTLQPLHRFPGLDAAILFSDILVVPEALGQPYRFAEKGGIEMDWTLQGPGDLARLCPEGAPERLAYVSAAMRTVREALGKDKALLGFAGSPWTLACYMVEGGSSKTFSKVKALYFEHPAAFGQLMETLCETIIAYLRALIEAGADALQLFDSWAAVCPSAHYEAMSVRWMRRIVEALPPEVPVIVYAKGMASHAPALATTGAAVLGADWTVDLPAFRDALPEGLAVQGNLDPCVLDTTPEITARETRALLKAMGGRPGHIFNLGHGIHPTARVECMEALVDTVGSSAVPAV